VFEDALAREEDAVWEVTMHDLGGLGKLLDGIEIGCRCQSAVATLVYTVPAIFTRNSFLPFHPGAAEWYHHKATTGVVRGDQGRVPLPAA
jgi:hypothetical protein